MPLRPSPVIRIRIGHDERLSLGLMGWKEESQVGQSTSWGCSKKLGAHWCRYSAHVQRIQAWGWGAPVSSYPPLGLHGLLLFASTYFLTRTPLPPTVLEVSARSRQAPRGEE